MIELPELNRKRHIPRIRHMHFFKGIEWTGKGFQPVGTQSTTVNKKSFEKISDRIISKGSKLRANEKYFVIRSFDDGVYRIINRKGMNLHKSYLKTISKCSDKPKTFYKFLRLKYARIVTVSFPDTVKHIVLNDDKIYFVSHRFIYIYTPYSTHYLEVEAKAIFVNKYLYVLTEKSIKIYGSDLIKEIKINKPCHRIAVVNNTIFLAYKMYVCRIEDEVFVESYNCRTIISKFLHDDKYLFVKAGNKYLARIGLYDRSFEILRHPFESFKVHITKDHLIAEPCGNVYIFLDKNDFSKFKVDYNPHFVLNVASCGSELHFQCDKGIGTIDISKPIGDSLDLYKDAVTRGEFSDGSSQSDSCLSSAKEMSSTRFQAQKTDSSEENIKFSRRLMIGHLKKEMAEERKLQKILPRIMRNVERCRKKFKKFMKWVNRVKEALKNREPFFIYSLRISKHVFIELPSNRVLKKFRTRLTPRFFKAILLDEDPDNDCYRLGFEVRTKTDGYRRNIIPEILELKDVPRELAYKIPGYIKKLRLSQLEEYRKRKNDIPIYLQASEERPEVDCEDIKCKKDEKMKKELNVIYDQKMVHEPVINEKIFEIFKKYNNYVPDEDFDRELQDLIDGNDTKREQPIKNDYNLERVNRIFRVLKQFKEDSTDSESDSMPVYFDYSVENREIDEYLEKLEVFKEDKVKDNALKAKLKNFVVDEYSNTDRSGGIECSSSSNNDNANISRNGDKTISFIESQKAGDDCNLCEDRKVEDCDCTKYKNNNLKSKVKGNFENDIGELNKIILKELDVPPNEGLDELDLSVLEEIVTPGYTKSRLKEDLEEFQFFYKNKKITNPMPFDAYCDVFEYNNLVFTMFDKADTRVPVQHFFSKRHSKWEVKNYNPEYETFRPLESAVYEYIEERIDELKERQRKITESLKSEPKTKPKKVFKKRQGGF